MALPGLYMWSKLIDQNNFLRGWPALTLFEFHASIFRLCSWRENFSHYARMLDKEIIQLAVPWITRNGYIRGEVMESVVPPETSYGLYIGTRDGTRAAAQQGMQSKLNISPNATMRHASSTYQIRNTIDIFICSIR
jgi:hypothetical protein